MFLSRVVPLTLLLATSSCAYRTAILYLDRTPRSPTPLASVRMLGQEPAERYRVIAFVSVSPDWALGAGYDRLSRRLAREAAKLGGDAVLLDTESLGHSQLKAKVIVFTDSTRLGVGSR